MKNQAVEALCAKCARAAGCTFPGDTGEPTVSCNAFESIEGLWSAIALEPDRPDSSRLEGLCVDCGNRTSCVFRTREGGTWHCEEYC